MKLSKQDTTLCEKDALQDLLDAEKLLMNYYATALTEGSCRPLRRQIMKLYSEHADTQFAVFEQMLQRGYYEVQPAEKMMIAKRPSSSPKSKSNLAERS